MGDINYITHITRYVILCHSVGNDTVKFQFTGETNKREKDVLKEV